MPLPLPSSSTPQRTPPPATTMIDDLIQCSDNTTEENVVSIVRARFLEDQIFTRLSYPILLAVNPYKDIRHTMEETSHTYFTEYKTHHQGQLHPPHIFQYVNHAYFYMRRTGQDQSIILSGVSGSGKSEMHYWILHHLMTLCTHNSPANKKRIHQWIDNAHHLVEAFGHTQSLLGNNISKMGKIVSYQFNDRGRMIGAKWAHCLLDTSALCASSNSSNNTSSGSGGGSSVGTTTTTSTTSSDDKTFHIFYYLLYGASGQERIDLHLDDIVQQLHENSTSSSSSATVAATAASNGFLSKQQHKEPRPTQIMIDLYTERYKQTKKFAQSMGITKQKWRQLMRILAAVLHLGHIQFTHDSEAAAHGGSSSTSGPSSSSSSPSNQHTNILGIDADSTDTVAAQVKSITLLGTVADLLGVDPAALENVLIYKTRLVHHDLTTHVLNPYQAYHQRDTLCQTLYTQVVTWLIYKINARLVVNKQDAFNLLNLVDFPGPATANDPGSGLSSSTTTVSSALKSPSSLLHAASYSASNINTFDDFCMTSANEHLHDMMLQQLFDNQGKSFSSPSRSTSSPVPASTCMTLFQDPTFVTAWRSITHSTQRPDQLLSLALSGMNNNNKKSNTPVARKQATCFHSSDTILSLKKYTGTVSHYSVCALGDRLTTQSYADAVSLFSPTQCTLELAHQLFTEPNNNTNTNESASKQLQQQQQQPQESRDPCTATIDKMMSLLRPSNKWWILCLRPNSLTLPHSCDAKTVTNQVRYYHLPSLIRQLQQFPSYMTMSYTECAQRYVTVLEEEGDDLSQDDPVHVCYAMKDAFAWQDHDAKFMDDQDIVYLSPAVWYALEYMLRNIEKREQKRLKCITKGIPFDDDMSPSCSRNPSCYDMSMDHESMTSASCYGDQRRPCYPMDTESICASSYMCDGSMAEDDTASAYSTTHDPHENDHNRHHQHRRRHRHRHRHHQRHCDDTATTIDNSEQGEEDDEDEEDDNDNDSERHTGGGKSKKRKRRRRGGCIRTPRLGVSRSRGCWVCLTWMTTWWLPSFVLHYVGGMRRSDIRMAWREKVTLCFFILLLCAAMVWFIAFFGQLVCPHQDLFTQSELQSKSDKDNAYISIRGEVFDLTSFAPRHWASEVIPASSLFQYAGQDASDLFPVQVSALCEGIHQPIPKEVTLAAHVNITDTTASFHDFRYFKKDYRPDWYFEQMVYLRKNYRLGFMGYDPVDILNQASMPVQIGGINTQRQWAILHDHVYDLTSYMKGGRSLQYPAGMTPSSSVNSGGGGDTGMNMTVINYGRNGTSFGTNTTSDANYSNNNNHNRASPSVNMDFIDNSITELFRQLAGTDISAHFDALPMDGGLRARQLTCLRNLFFVGKVDTRNALQCQLSEYLLLLITAFLCSVILFKFLAAFRLGHQSYTPLPNDPAAAKNSSNNSNNKNNSDTKNKSSDEGHCDLSDNPNHTNSNTVNEEDDEEGLAFASGAGLSTQQQQQGKQRHPDERQFYNDKFVICQVPCYTEGEESLRKTIDSLAVMKYDDQRKLLFLIADGMIVGSGNDRSTPRIVLDILGVAPDDQLDEPPVPMDFISLGEGMRQHNRAKVYSGLYHCHGHVVPFLVVVKVGTVDERQKSGNRGKRDSQMILMRFLNKIHYDLPMTPLELEMHHQLKNVIGVLPSFYELVLMVDADTEVATDALNHMVSSFVKDPKLVGLCGETVLSNEKESWVTMIQVYEYYISHHLAKAFESLFGSVTCLPGCFCMYRVRAATKNQPLLASHQVIADYAENNVNTLHKKNLLHLGEDRYLTTLILKHFPTYKTKFNPDASCRTNAPDQWQILLSQRRRWINSTIHNLGELMFLPQLCGFCCFSMRFVVMLDLLSTLVMPAVVCYLGYLIYQLCTSTSQVPLMSIITLAGVYGLQAIIFIARRKWEHVGWMIVYILAIPVFSFFIPIYAFWHFDDFSWGNTRIVVGDNSDNSSKKKKNKRNKKRGGGGAEQQQVAVFDPASIPVQRWVDHEQQLLHQQWLDDNEKHSMTSRRQRQSHQRSELDKKMQMMMNMDFHNNNNSYGGGGHPEDDAYGGQNVDIHDLDSHGNPSEAAIIQEIDRLLQQHDLMHLTKKQVRDSLSKTFGIDMTSYRDFINNVIEDLLAER